MNLNNNSQNKLAERFHSLHHTGKTLVLPNAWDCISAKIYEKEGFPATATSSASVSWAYGYADGEYIPSNLMIESIRQIANCTKIPVTADIEEGFCGNDLFKLEEFITKVIQAGAVGINLEDSMPDEKGINSIEKQVDKIKLVKTVSQKMGINIYLNARVDTMAHVIGSDDAKLEATIERADEYQKAGADGIFIPFITDMGIIRKLKPNIHLPLNIMMNSFLSIEELKSIGVERVSLGARTAMSVYAKLRKLSKDIHSSDNWEMLFDKGLTYEEINAWMARN